MPIYPIGFVPIDSLTFSGASPWSLQQGDGQGWQYGNYVFSYDAETLTTLQISDADGVMQDDPANPEWGSGNSHTAHSQVLGAPVTVGGTVYEAGRRVEDEYELNVTDEDGVVYRLVAVSVQADPSNPYSSHVVIGFTFDQGVWPPPGAVLTSVAGSAQDNQVLDDPSTPPCFTTGTLIQTPRGPRAVETLLIGDLVTTLDHGPQPLRWIGRASISAAGLAADPSNRPIRIARGALGDGLPRRDLLVSPQHRIMLRSRVAERMFGEAEVLVPARALLDLPGVGVDPAPTGVEYWHFSLPGHQIVQAEGAPAESLYLGQMVLQGIPPQLREELRRNYPRLDDYALIPPVPARPMLRRREGAKLVERIIRNHHDPIETADETAKARRA